ncbi:hypothetical protein OG819_42580 [Streptomyces sp. NBC_01549]|uniref:hypothetical protein n=1 Tax=Streptomyces sp. NBC_01549 TaxID=2975874 RepID=UPI00225483A2|nr:hypothetical protein [Streptomyces sp. NBC_01549]MCX4596103.1 hypothetical protein [Streptomyces sp. NBC_01549]
MSDTTDAPAVPPMPENPPAAGRRWPHPLMTGLVGLVVGAGAVGLAWGLSSSGSSAPKTFTLSGAMTLTGDNVPSGETSEDCTGYSGFDDIAKGAGVTVYDSAGKVVATGSLGTGKPKSAACVFPVSVAGVPEGSKFYQVEVSHRGKITVSSAEAKAGRFAASLG